MMKMISCSISLVIFFCLIGLPNVAAQKKGKQSNLDQFTYKTADYETGKNKIYPPNKWINVQCADLDQCLGWPDDFNAGLEWSLKKNDCQWCPIDGGGNCGKHHQSPIDLNRNRAIAGHPDENECIDTHWMKYFDSSCSWNELKRLNAFSVERHALKIVQPVELVAGTKDSWRNSCKSGGSFFGRIDYSKGFSDWWHLSHMDLHVPSEHAQEGRIYDGEIQLYHFYSKSESEAKVANQMGTVSIFLQSYNNTPDNDVINKLICQWRKVEAATLSACNLANTVVSYDGCSSSRRRLDGNMTTTPVNVDIDVSRHLRPSFTKEGSTLPPKALSPHDVLSKNWHPVDGSEQNHRIVKQEQDFDSMDHFDWDEFIAGVYEKEERDMHGRHLADYDNVAFHNYFALIGCKTEYYFRYMGTQTVPPCYAKYNTGNNNGLVNRGNSNHWRVMKDPLLISKRQLYELHRLIKDRVAPPTDPRQACKRDTAAKPDPNDSKKISVARPLQTSTSMHHEVFCECQDWKSKWNEDQEWCKIKSQSERYFDHPYNYDTNGF